MAARSLSTRSLIEPAKLELAMLGKKSQFQGREFIDFKTEERLSTFPVEFNNCGGLGNEGN